MLDKSFLLKRYSHFIDEEGLFIKSIDQLICAEKDYSSQITEFLTPDLVFVLSEIVRLYTELVVVEMGVFKNAERKKLHFSYGYDSLDENDQIGLLEIIYNQKFSTLTHRDALGALMSLGIKRNKLGDINVFEGGFQIAVDCSLIDYFMNEMDKIGRAGVLVKRSPLSEAKIIQIDKKQISGTVKSIRLDSLVALCFSISRNDAQELIRAERVKVNYSTNDHVDYVPNINDLISVRGFGRFYVDEIGGYTKKDRLRVHLSFVIH